MQRKKRFCLAWLAPPTKPSLALYFFLCVSYEVRIFVVTSLSLIHAHSLCFTHTHIVSLSLSHTFSVLHTHTHCLSLTYSVSLYLSISHTHTLTNSVSLWHALVWDSVRYIRWKRSTVQVIIRKEVQWLCCTPATRIKNFKPFWNWQLRHLLANSCYLFRQQEKHDSIKGISACDICDDY